LREPGRGPAAILAEDDATGHDPGGERHHGHATRAPTSARRPCDPPGGSDARGSRAPAATRSPRVTCCPSRSP
jgi:hypothetical protein